MTGSNNHPRPGSGENDNARRRSSGSAALRASAATPQAIVVIAILFALQVTDGIDQAVLSFTAPFVKGDLSIGFESLGAAFSAAYIGTALGAVLFGTLADYIGRKISLCLAAAGFSIGSFCTIFIHTGAELTAVRLLTGLALGGLFPVVASLVLETVARHLRATAVTLVSVGSAAGVSLCGPLVAVIEPHFGWRAVFIIGAAIPAFLAILAIIFISNPPPAMQRADIRDKTVRNPLDSITSLFRSSRWKMTFVLWAAFISAAVPMFFCLSWLPSLAHAAHINSDLAAIGPSIYSVSGLLFALLIARVVDKTGFLPVALTSALSAPALILLGHSFGTANAFLVACALSGALLVSSVNLLGVVAAMLYEDKLRARGVGWAVAVMRIGAALAPWLGGVLIARAVPVGTLFFGLAMSPLICALAIVALWKMEQRRARNLDQVRTATPAAFTS